MNGSKAKRDNKMVRIRPSGGADVPPSKKARTSPRKDQGQSNGSKTNGNGHQPVVDKPNSEESLLWVDKYKPKTIKQIIGQQGDKSNMRKLMTWIQNWTKNHGDPNKKGPQRPAPWLMGSGDGSWAKAALLSGPPGVGKTTTAHLVAKELGYDVMELNASDARSKKLLEKVLSDAMASKSLSQASTKRIILMDEVDGMAGNEDRGGVAELIQLMKKSRIPIVCMCNDRQHPKIRSLANHCFDLRFHRPNAQQIRGAMLSVCFKEKVKIAPDALDELIVACNQDVRQVLHHLSMLKARGSDEKLTLSEAKDELNQAKKTSIKVGPFDVVRKVFSSSDHKDMSLMDKSDLFFHDYSLGPLFNQEMYLHSVPHAAKNNKEAMKLISKAADSFCDGDLVDKTIRSRNSWSLLPMQAMFSSVIPGEYMSGHLRGQIQFPTWFGKYSKQNKFNRILQELQCHTRLSAGVSKRSMNEEFSQHLRDAVTRPLAKRGAEGISDSIEVMKQYSLLREDLDNLIELCQWPDRDSPLSSVESKVKAAFTRQYNKDVVLPFATGSLTMAGRKRSAAASAEDAWAAEEAGEDEDEEEEKDDIESDGMIKAKKAKATKAPAKQTASASGKGRGGGKGASSKRGRK